MRPLLGDAVIRLRRAGRVKYHALLATAGVRWSAIAAAVGLRAALDRRADRTRYPGTGLPTSRVDGTIRARARVARGPAAARITAAAFIALYDERDRNERQATPVTVVGPSENAE